MEAYFWRLMEPPSLRRMVYHFGKKEKPPGFSLQNFLHFPASSKLDVPAYKVGPISLIHGTSGAF